MRLALNDLLPNTNYAIAIRAVGDGSVSEWSTRKTFTTVNDTVKPDTPTGITWVDSGNSFHGEWDAVTTNEEGATIAVTRYEITLVASVITKVLSVPANTGSDGKVKFDLTFEENRVLFGTPQPSISFSVRTVDNKNLKSNASTPIIATNAAPNSPSSIIGSPAADQIALQWAKSTSNDVVSYRLFVGTSSGFTPSAGNKIFDGDALSFSYTSTTYSAQWFKVVSVDDFGQESTATTIAAALTPISPFIVDTTPPAVPTGLNVVITNNANGIGCRAVVTWNANTEPDLAGYSVRYVRHGDYSWNETNFSKEETSGLIELPVAYGIYWFQIRAYDQFYNYSAWNTAATFVAPANAAPQNVTGLGAVPGRDSISYYWGSVSDTDIKNYELQISTDNFATTTYSYLTGTSTSLTISGLAPSTTYYARVKAIDTGGLSSAYYSSTNTTATTSFPLTPLSDGNPPSSSPTPTVTGEIGSLAITWPAVLNADAVTYEVHLSTTNGFTANSGTKIGEVSGTFFVAQNVAYGTTYYVKIIAKDRDGAAAASTQASGTPVKVSGADSTIIYSDVGADPNGAANDAYNDSILYADSIQVGAVNLWDGGRDEFDENSAFIHLDVSELFEYIGEGAQITLSYDIKADIAGYNTGPYHYQGSGWNINDNGAAINITTDWVRHSHTTTVHDFGVPPGYAPGWIGWYDPSNPTNVLYLRNVKIERGSKATDWSPSVRDIENEIDAAQSAAQTFATNAVTTSANGKNKVTRSTSVASGAGIAGDTWFQYAGSNLIGMWIHNGTSWVSHVLENSVIGTLDAGKINTGFLDAARIQANTIGADKITAGQYTGGIFEVAAGGYIQSTLYTSSGGSAGFRISNTGIDIKTGSINAGTLTTGTVAGGVALTVNGDIMLNGSQTINGTLQTYAYSASGGTDGVQITADGIVVRGADSYVFAEVIQGGTFSAGNIVLGLGGNIVINGGYLKSNTYTGTAQASNPSGAGFYLGNDGIRIDQGIVSASALTAGTISGTNTITLSGANAKITGTGFELSGTGLTITTGSVSAAALKIYASANSMPVAYSDFEHSSSWYTSNIALVTATGSIQTASPWSGYQFYRTVRVGTTGASSVVFSPTDTTYNIPVVAGQDYNFSLYVRNNSGTPAVLAGIKWSNATFTFSSTTTTTGSWQRINISGTAPAGATACLVYTQTSTLTAGAAYDIDGLQFEEKYGLTVPTVWRAPANGTTIDGNIIKTGSIQSNNYVANSVGGTPMWSVAMSGAAQFTALSVTGNTVLGYVTSSGGDTSQIASANYIAGTTGWVISNNSGAAEFNNVSIRGTTSVGTAGGLEIINSVIANPFQSGTSWAVTKYALGQSGWTPALVWASYQASDSTFGGANSGGLKLSSPYNTGITGAATINLIGLSTGATHARIGADAVELASSSMKLSSLNSTSFDINVINTNLLVFQNGGGERITYNFGVLGKNILRSSTSNGATDKRLDIQATDIFMILDGVSSTEQIQFHCNNSNRASITNATNNAGIVFPNTNQVYFKNYNGDAYVGITASAFNPSSDIKFKEKLQPTKGALDLVKQMKVYDYEQPVEKGGQHRRTSWNNDKRRSNPKQRGLVAQELEKIAPDFVVIDDVEKDSEMAVSLYPLVSTALAAIKELSEKVEKLEAELKTFK